MGTILLLIATLQAGSFNVQPTARTPVVKITNTYGGLLSGGTDHGTGIITRDDGVHAWVLTCAHIFRDGTGKVIVCGGGLCYEARVVKVDQNRELALLKIASPSLGFRQLATARPPPGSIVQIAGYTYGKTLQFRTSQIQEYDSVSGAVLFRGGQAPSGWSGGPIFNDKCQIVGIIWGLSAGTPIDVIHTFLSDTGLAPSWKASLGAGIGDTMSPAYPGPGKKLLPGPGDDPPSTDEPQASFPGGGSPPIPDPPAGTPTEPREPSPLNLEPEGPEIVQAPGTSTFAPSYNLYIYGYEDGGTVAVDPPAGTDPDKTVPDSVPDSDTDKTVPDSVPADYPLEVHPVEPSRPLVATPDPLTGPTLADIPADTDKLMLGSMPDSYAPTLPASDAEPQKPTSADNDGTDWGKLLGFAIPIILGATGFGAAIPATRYALTSWGVASRLRRRRKNRKKPGSQRQAGYLGNPPPGAVKPLPPPSPFQQHPSILDPSTKVYAHQVEEKRPRVVDQPTDPGPRVVHQETIVEAPPNPPDQKVVYRYPPSEKGLGQMRRAMKLLSDEYPAATSWVKRIETTFALVQSGDNV